MRFLILLALLAIGAGALFATAPKTADFERDVESRLAAHINGMDPSAAQDDVSRLLLTTCKLGENGCARLIRSLMDITVEDRLLYSVADLQLGRGDPVRCYGLLNKVVCPSL